MKQFKSKKLLKKQAKKKRRLVFAFFFIFSYVFMVNYLNKNHLKKQLLKKDVNYTNFNFFTESENVINKIVNNPVNFLNNNIKKISGVSKNIKTEKTKEKGKSTKEIVKSDSRPVIYVYNTHQTEEYNDNYSVLDAGLYLSNKLNGNGYNTMFESNSMKVFLEERNLKYYKSYLASKTYLNNALKENPTLKYFFDIHRDSASKKITTINYQNKNYAKVLFVVGTDNSNYEKNNINAVRLNEIVKSFVPTISRGVVYHGGKGYNGVYNQDISENVFLIEVGGKENTKEEVENTLNVLINSVEEYIRGIL